MLQRDQAPEQGDHKHSEFGRVLGLEKTFSVSSARIDHRAREIEEQLLKR